MSGKKTYRYDFDDFSLDLKNQKLLKSYEPVILTHKAFQTLTILVQNFGQIVDKENIYTQLWSDSFVEESNLTQYIYILRKSLGRQPNGQPYIETINKQGYRFNGQVKEVCDQETSPDFSDSKAAIAQFLEENLSESNLDNAPENHFDEKPTEPNFTELFNDKRLKSLVFVLLIVCIASTGLYLFRQYKNSRQLSETGIKPIAVLPFAALDEESSDEKFGFGMADAIITRLSNLKRIPVRPTSAVFSFTGQDKADPQTIGRSLGVDLILEGTVQRSGQRIRINVQLIDVNTGIPLWAEKFDENYTDVFAVQDSISMRVAQSLSANFAYQSTQNLASGTTTNTDAYQAYQLGVFFWNTRSKEGLLKAVDYFNRAIELDPNYAQAYALLADSYNMLGYYRFANRPEMLKKARESAEKALSLNDSVAEAYIAMSYVQQNEPNNSVAARRSIERAIEIAPYNSTARLRRAWSLLVDGNLQQSLNEMRLAQEYDPLSAVSNGALCNLLIFKRDFNEAVNVCEKATELSPDTATNRLALANAYFFNGRAEDAVTQADLSVKAGGEQKNSALGSLGYFYAKTGKRKEAESIFIKLQPEAEDNPELFNDLALIAYSSGKTKEALFYFKKAIEKRSLSLLIFRYDPTWDEIRADNRFQEIVSQTSPSNK